MKILWIKTDFLHPTTRGGQIRTLEMLRSIHRRHEVHYVCFDGGENPEGAARAHEYSTAAYPVAHRVAPRASLRFAGELAVGLFSPTPVSVARYRSEAMRRRIAELLRDGRFESVVCDFLFPAANIPDLSRAVLFQHNIEAAIWRRHAEHAANAAARAYFRLQARRMEAYEKRVCQAAGYVVAVSQSDREQMVERYGVTRIGDVPTGVDMDYFAAPASASACTTELVFVGSMDWLPNIDAVKFFVSEILPRIRARLPECRLAIVGRSPGAAIAQLAAHEKGITVTGTVPDVRPWLWGAAVSIVPLRIGGGTRLKIFEAMAAGVPVVATTVGAEGLPVQNGRHLLIADDPEEFAGACVSLLNDAERRRALAAAGRELVAERFSWDAAARALEEILQAQPRPDQLR